VKVALSIAGSDPGGGAGIQADLATFHQFGVFGTAVVTAVTAQNTRGVRRWEPVSEALVREQIAALWDDLPPDAVKTGMLGATAVVRAGAELLEEYRPRHFVLDPIGTATSGAPLIDAAGERLVAERLVPLAALVTPNLNEASRLLDAEVRSPDAMERAGKALIDRGAGAALVKGGHLEGADLLDVLVTAGGVRRFRHPRQETTSTHGTGCALSAAIAAGLAHGRPLERAVEDAIDFTQRAIAAAPKLGGGRGPLNLFVPAPKAPPSAGLD